MSTVSYATTENLGEWITETKAMPDDAERLLQRASQRIDAFVRASFDVDRDTRLPRDSEVAAALAEATCAQVEFWLEVGEGHDIDGIDGQLQVTGGGSWSAPPKLAPRAKDILNAANLMNLGWVGV